MCCILSKFYIKPQLEALTPDYIQVVSYRNSTSNHNWFLQYVNIMRLYLIEILHQTTTQEPCFNEFRCCILSKFYIKPQLGTETLDISRSCILSKFYIKPQRCQSYESGSQSCILSKFYIKPQLLAEAMYRLSSCILSKFYIKPQLIVRVEEIVGVVSYRNSTSNHNVELVQ